MKTENKYGKDWRVNPGVTEGETALATTGRGGELGRLTASLTTGRRLGLNLRCKSTRRLRLFLDDDRTGDDDDRTGDDDDRTDDEDTNEAVDSGEVEEGETNEG